MCKDITKLTKCEKYKNKPNKQPIVQNTQLFQD